MRLIYPQGVCIVISNGDDLLAVKRKKPPFNYCLPGGKVDPGEGIVEAAIRELYEETGLGVLAEDLFPLYSGYCGATDEPTFWVTTFFAKAHTVKSAPPEPELQAQYVKVDDFIATNAFRTYNLEVFLRARALEFMS